ncbi:AraC family transcriptional regulator [Oscillospiraceae bacterium MB08-C2-2]|nr:AraC family transcriptional regulator [Oscillospiraceae bacterium MB08-C2-2]
MDWVSQLNSALRYIEDNLDSEIHLEEIAQIVCCSGFHFQRMFSYMAGVLLSEYIRRRRMTRAAFDLQNSEDKIIDIALKYGYDSPTAFNRAFQSIHGISPSGARQKGVSLKAYQPISFKITIRGEAEMNYSIVEKEAFRIVGPKISCPWSPEKQEGFSLIPQFWAQQHQEGIVPRLCTIMNQEPMGVLGVCVGDWQKEGRFDYYIAVSSSQPVLEGTEEYQVPAGTWAVFECRGAMPFAIQRMQERIMTEWLPGSGYRYANAPDIEVYTDGDQSSEDYLCYIWVPVEK